MRYVDKQFLSPCYGESGNIVVSISSPTVELLKEEKWNNYVNMDISISDCSKTISLDFDFTDREQFDKRIAKIDKMMEVLLNARRAMHTAMVEFTEVKRQVDEEDNND